LAQSHPNVPCFGRRSVRFGTQLGVGQTNYGNWQRCNLKSLVGHSECNLHVACTKYCLVGLGCMVGVSRKGVGWQRGQQQKAVALRADDRMRASDSRGSPLESFGMDCISSLRPGNHVRNARLGVYPNTGSSKQPSFHDTPASLF
jgi:hypothetical protein